MWIDVHSSLKRELFFHLKKYLWKKQVELIDLDTENDSHKPSIYVGFVWFYFNCRTTYRRCLPIWIEDLKFRARMIRERTMSMPISWCLTREEEITAEGLYACNKNWESRRKISVLFLKANMKILKEPLGSLHPH